MAPLPKKRHSNTRKRIRRDAIKLTVASLVRCPNCSEMMRPHYACKKCGYYNGVRYVNVEEKAKVTAKKKILKVLVGENALDETKEKFSQMLENGELDEKEIEIENAVQPF
jgi:ribosomal protein L32